MKKKILFWIESGTMNIFGVAKYLQNDINAEFFAIYDVCLLYTSDAADE